MKAGKDFIGVGCGALIIKDGKMLLVKRSRNAKTEPGAWSRPGGEVDFGEKASEAVVREVLEETGVKIGNVRYHDLTELIISDKHWISIGFIADYVSGDAQNLEPHCHEDVRWFDLEEIPDNLAYYTKHAIDKLITFK